MKKLLSSVAILALITSGVNAGATQTAGTVTATGTVQAASIVKIGAASGSALVDDIDKVESSTLALGDLSMNSSDAATTKEFDIYLTTNTLGIVDLTFGTTPNLTNLKNGITSTLTTAYSFTKSATYNAGNNADINTTPTVRLADGTQNTTVADAAVGKLKLTVATATSQIAGEYSANMQVTVQSAI